ncbi:MAG: hypothetical protein Q9182_006291 [Xanthomendoza sp. 2 TL-2023]
MRAKFYGEGKPIDKEELDELTGDFDCVLDMPCCFFAEELCAAYPDAKVVLNTRDADSWIKSADATVLEVFCDNDINDLEKCKRRFLEHNEHVRQVVPKDRLLEYRIQEGWKPLAKFLGLEGRSGTIPSTNGEMEFVEYATMIWKESMRSSLKNVISVTIFLGDGVELEVITPGMLLTELRQCGCYFEDSAWGSDYCKQRGEHVLEEYCRTEGLEKPPRRLFGSVSAPDVPYHICP